MTKQTSGKGRSSNAKGLLKPKKASPRKNTNLHTPKNTNQDNDSYGEQEEDSP
jgi:hypothetical protein